MAEVETFFARGAMEADINLLPDVFQVARILPVVAKVTTRIQKFDHSPAHPLLEGRLIQPMPGTAKRSSDGEAGVAKILGGGGGACVAGCSKEKAADCSAAYALAVRHETIHPGRGGC